MRTGVRRQLTGLALAALVLLAGAVWGIDRQGGDGPADDGGPAVSGTVHGPVVRVADGDTLTVRTPEGREERVRIIGINTPETHDPVECGGAEAAEEMERMATGATVTVTPDPTQDRRDRFGRLLGYVESGGNDFGLEMIRAGLAIAYPFGRPFRRYGTYLEAQRQAEAERRGSWGRCPEGIGRR